MRHKWRRNTMGVYYCKRKGCRAIDQPHGVHWIDADGMAKELSRIARRNDCKGSKDRK